MINVFTPSPFPKPEFLLAFNFLTSSHLPILDHDNCLLISNNKAQLSFAKNLTDDHIKGYIKILKLDSTHVYLAVNHCDEAMYINGQIMAKNRAYFLRHGSSIRNTKVNPIYFSDITSAFRKEEETQLINFIIDDLEYKFPVGNIGIHKMSLNAQSGNLIGIMGASGAGKSTFLSLLNGSLTPTSGKVTINGVDIHHQAKEIEGIIGHVSQDDLLMEDLTVFQNLYFNAQLCYDNHSDAFLTKKTLELLKSIGLYETKDLKTFLPSSVIVEEIKYGE